MAMVSYKVRTCDRDDSTVNVERRRIFLPDAGPRGRAVSFDACEQCRNTVPLSEWEKLLPRKPRATKASLVVSEEEVLAAAKKSPRKRTVKKAPGRR